MLGLQPPTKDLFRLRKMRVNMSIATNTLRGMDSQFSPAGPSRRVRGKSGNSRHSIVLTSKNLLSLESEAAERLNVSRRLVQSARTVRVRYATELVNAVTGRPSE